jgi:choline dehydrogenase-like flavoprotein
MADARNHDVIIIGPGAGGGTLAHRPAPTGKRILLLERGDHLPRERDNRDSTAVFVKRGIPRSGILVRQARKPVSVRGQPRARPPRGHRPLRPGPAKLPAAVNPSLTAIAKALRVVPVGDHIAERPQ